ncbi:MAG: aldo/keto reductase [Erysipelotrichaceae bacterium]|nr:aldo/keto reductase [Erysipelotrichaceae bacterium]
MEKRKLGNFEVSAVGMGCMGFSHGYGKAPDADVAIETIRTAYENGCTLFDTAEVYGNIMYYAGHNEQLVGKAVAPFRKDIILSSKFFINIYEYGHTITLYDAIKGHLMASLENLNTDYLDIYYLHRLNEAIPIEEVAQAMGKLIDEGLIRGWGLSQVSSETLMKAHQVTPVTAVQSLYNMMERGIERNIIPYCMENNIGVVPYSPLGNGFLAGNITDKTKFTGDDVRRLVPQLSKKNIAQNMPIVDLIDEFALRKECSLGNINLAWMLNKYPNVVPIPGALASDEVINNLNAANIIFTPEELEELEKRLNEIEIHGHTGHVATVKKGFKLWGR